jgi:hypothetical protein
MVNLLKEHIKELEQFNLYRIFWLRLSGFVAIAIILIVLDWAVIGNNNFLWIPVSAGLVLSVAWWYWTMMIVRQLLHHRLIELEILKEIIIDISEIKKNFNQNT